MNKKVVANVSSSVNTDQNVIRVGAQLLKNCRALEKLAGDNQGLQSEPATQNENAAAYGVFTVTHDITKFTKAALFSEVGKKTQLFARFTTALHEHCAVDAQRDVHEFAVKFYTEEGNWDMVGNNTPVFFQRDPLHSSKLGHSIKRDPSTNMHRIQHNWDFWTSLPEALHQVTMLMSDRGRPASYRHMDGFGSQTFSMINHANKRVLVKFHFKSNQGIKNLTDSEAIDIIRKDRKSHQTDLYNAIEQGNNPSWTLKIQVMTEEQAEKFAYNPFDLTKVWPHYDFPLIEVGIMELNTNPENFSVEVEAAKFNPANIVSGISLTTDKPQQGDVFATDDALRDRLGEHHRHIEANTPCYSVDSYPRYNENNAIAYQANCYGEWLLNNKGVALRDAPTDTARHTGKIDYFSQVGDLFRMMTPEQKQALFKNTAVSIAEAPIEVQKRHIKHCLQADPSYGKGIARALSVPLSEI